jgi:ABC-2 type transport system permease protein
MFPVMLLTIFSAVFSGGSNPQFNLYVQNKDIVDGVPTNLSAVFVEVLNATGVLSIKEIPSNLSIDEFLEEFSKPFSPKPRLLIIPEGFHDKVLNATISSRMGVIVSTLNYVISEYWRYLNESARHQIQEGMEQVQRFNSTLKTVKADVILLIDPSDSAAKTVEGIVDQVVSAFNNRLLGTEPPIDVEVESLIVREWKAVDYYLPGYIGAFIMTNGVIGVLGVVTDMKRRGVLKRFMVTPLTKAEFVLSVVISQTILALILTLVLVGVARGVFGSTGFPDVWSWLLIFLGALLFTGLGMLLAGFVKDVEAASALGNIIAFPMMFLSGSFWPLEIMPDYMQAFAKALPLTYLSEGLRFTMIYGNPSLATLDYVIISVLAAVMIVAASLAIKWRSE